MSGGHDIRPVVLVADDDELMRLMISEAAESAGFDVQLTMNGRQAVDRATDIEPDIVLLDVNMPELDGYAVCRALRGQERFRLTPIVMVTGDDDPESIDRAYECGATDFVAKPINWPLLAHRLKYILRGAENLKALDAREQRIHRLAYYDDLTGLPNRALLREHTTNLLERTAGGAGEVALVHMDLDGFKRVNDSFGYLVGDKMLKAVARRLSAVIDADTTPSLREVLLARVRRRRIPCGLRRGRRKCGGGAHRRTLDRSPA